MIETRKVLAKGFEYSFCHERSVHGCEVLCGQKTDDEVWELALKLAALCRNGIYVSFLKEESGREERARNRFFENGFLDIDPGTFDVRFSHSMLEGRKITVFSLISLQREIERLFDE